MKIEFQLFLFEFLDKRFIPLNTFNQYKQISILLVNVYVNIQQRL